MHVSVIISNFNGSKYLPRLLETLRAQCGVELQIIVVDRHSNDGSSEILALNPDVMVVREPPETGLVSGYAVGAEHARHELLFFCNEDMWFDPNCLQQLARRIDLSRRVAATDPWQWTYDRLVWIHGATRFHAARLDLTCPYPFRRYDFKHELAAGGEVPFGCAGAVLIHRAVYREVGGWDRGFFLDHEDVDLFLRTWQAGWKCITVPEAKVYHAVNVSNDKTIQQGRLQVSKRRYISGRASVIIMGVKYFSEWYALIPVLVWCGLLFRHAFLLRFRQVWWNLLAGMEALSRLPAALRYRQLKYLRNAAKPGEAFFTAPNFQARD